MTAKAGIPFVLSGPAGTGKTTLVQRLIAEFPGVVRSISYTTRSARSGETAGKDYVFVSEEDFKRRIGEGEFLEYVELYGSYYGTSRKWVDAQLAVGKHVFLVIDTQGAREVRSILPHVSIFVAPPSLDELERRLRTRQTEAPDKVERRLEWARTEMEAQKEYDYVIINDNLEGAYHVLRSIVVAEEHRNRWNKNV